MINIYDMTAYEINQKFLTGEISAVQIVENIFERIDKIDNKINSFVTLRKQDALLDAKRIDNKKLNGEKMGALAGVPIAIKDNMLCDGMRVTSCSKILENYISIYDATVVKKLKDSDAIIIGTTNMDEFAMGSTTKTSYWKKTVNPYDFDRVPGGSSGGSAASVSAGLIPVSLGSDTGGSIRQPSSFCGVVGLKPTYGRVSRYGLMAFASSLDQIGPIAKNVEDIALVMNVISGYDEYDATVSKRNVPDYTKFLNKDIKGLRIGIPKEYFVDGMNEELKNIVEESIEKYKKLGAEIVNISMPHTKYAVPAYYVIAPAEASSNLARFDGVRYGYRSESSNTLDDLYINTRTEGFGDEVKRRIIIGTYVLSAGFYDAYFKKAQKIRRIIKNDFDKAFNEVDVILTPVTPNVAFKLTDKKTPVELYLEDIYTLSANLAGVPGIAIPAGKINNLPVGIQLMGKYFDEETLIMAASAFEKIRGKWELPNID